jgi:cytochrome c peroxidase
MKNTKSYFLLISNIFGILGVLGVLISPIYAKNNPKPVEPIAGVPHKTTPYPLKVPAGFPDMVIPEDNPTTMEGVALGRMLYYDNIMHKDTEEACADCHLQEESFQTDNGVDQMLVHLNLAWTNNFLWKKGFHGTLEDVMIYEVEEFFKTDLARLNNSEKYKDLFKKAFGVDEITSKEAAYALAQFQRILTSGNSKFDQFYRGEVKLTAQETEGHQLFNSEKAGCFGCHGSALFTDNKSRNIGLDAKPSPGLMETTGNPKDLGKYKTPTIRNIEYTAPYMHDGRFATLEEVVGFYSTGVQNTDTVDQLMVNASEGGSHLTESEKAALVAFLKTLSDRDYLSNPELSSPFDNK